MSKKATKAVVKYKPLFADSDSAFKTERSLDTMISSGSYLVEITHNGADVGLPIEDCGEVHYIVGTLVVTDSGTGGRKQMNRVIGQILSFASRESKETLIYTRTFADGVWSEWYRIAHTGIYDNISTTDELVSTVTELVAENVRSKKFEDIVKRSATDISSLESSADATSVTIMGSSIDKGAVHTTKISAVTSLKAGVMTAEDKKALDGNVNSSSYSVVDAFGNIILKIDKEGLRTTEVTTSHGKLGELLDALAAAVEVAKREFGAEVNALKSAAVQASREIAGKIDSKADSDSFAVADSVGNIILKIDKEGLRSTEVTTLRGKLGELLDTLTAAVAGKIDSKADSDSFAVADSVGNIILKIDKEGLRTTEVTTLRGKLGELLDTLTAAVAGKIDSKADSDSFAVADAAGNIIFKVDKNGVHTTELTVPQGKLNGLLDIINQSITKKIDKKIDADSLSITDANGNVIFRVDKEGAHAPNLNVVTPTWVIAQVLGEVYIPSNIVRDSAGDVVSCDVLFSNGIAGTIVLARENGDVSHIAATHGGVNVEVEIIRENGNVKQINIL